MSLYNVSLESTNFSWEMEKEEPIYTRTLMIEEMSQIILTFILFIAGVGFNIAMIIQQILELRRKSPAFVVKRINCILLINLAASQIMVCFWVILPNALSRLLGQWYFGNAMCKIAQYFLSFSLLSQVYSILAVLIAQVTHSLSKRVTGASVMYLRFILPVWIISGLWSIPEVR